MMDLKRARDFSMDALEFEEAAIREKDGEIVGWHSVCFMPSGGMRGRPLGGGCHRDRMVARQIAIAEVAERAVFRLELESVRGGGSDLLRLRDFPSTCGFAAGFDRDKTRARAVAEAAERAAWCRWIDEKVGFVHPLDVRPRCSRLASVLASEFDDLLFFEAELTIECGYCDQPEGDGTSPKLRFGVVIGLQDGGAFPGSRVCSLGVEPWEHAVVEAWRHQRIFRRIRESDSGAEAERMERPFDRIHHFGLKSGAALAQIPAAVSESEQSFKVDLLEEVASSHRNLGIRVWRALDTSHISWMNGPIERFVY